MLCRYGISAPPSGGYAQRAHLPVQVRALDAERDGRIADAPFVLLQDGRDVFALEASRSARPPNALVPSPIEDTLMPVRPSGRNSIPGPPDLALPVQGFRSKGPARRPAGGLLDRLYVPVPGVRPRINGDLRLQRIHLGLFGDPRTARLPSLSSHQYHSPEVLDVRFCPVKFGSGFLEGRLLA